MAGTIKGITIEIGGDTSKLDKAISASNKQSQELTNELKNVNKMLKFDSSNVELLTQKQQILTEQIGATSDKLNILKQAQEQVEAQFQSGEIGADQYRAFQREIIATEGRLEALKNTLQQTNQQLADTGNEVEESSTTLEDLTGTIAEQERELADLRTQYTNVVLEQGKTSDEAKTLASQMKVLNDDLSDNKKQLNEAESEAKDLSDALEDTGDASKNTKDGFTIMKGAVSDLVSNAIQSAVSAITDFIGALFDLSEATEEYRQMQAKLEGSATSFGYSMDFANEKYKEFYSYVGDDQMATNAITNLMGLGLETKNLDSLVDGAIATWTAYGDSIPIESLTESITESINVSQVTGTLADTINWASLTQEQWNTVLGEGSAAQKAFNDALKDGESTEDAFSAALSATTDERDRANLVAGLLNETYGESKTKYDELAGSMLDANEAELELKDTQAEMGQAMEPVNTALTELKNDALEAVLPLVKNLAGAFSDLLTWMKQNPEAVNAIIAVIAGLVVAIGTLAIALNIGSIISAVTTAFGALNAAMMANPFVLIASLIAGLAVAFITLWNTSEGFRNFWIGIWESIKSAVSSAIEFITPILQSIWETMINVWNGISTTISTVMNVIMSVISTAWNAISVVITAVITVIAVTIGTYWNIYSTIISTVMNAIMTVVSTVWNAISGVISTVLNTIFTVISSVWNSISGVVSTVVNTISSVISTVWNTIKSVTISVWNAVKSAVEVPINTAKSVVTNAVNTIKSTVSSVWNAIKSTTTSVWNGIKSAIETPMNAAKNLVKGIIDSIKGFFNFSISWPKIPLPHFSIKPAGWSVGDLLKGKIPSLGIDWYAKGGIFDKPTIIPTLSGLKGVGEAGAEAVAPISTLIDYVKTGVHEAMQAMVYASPNWMMLGRQLDGQQGSYVNDLLDLLSYYFPKLIEASKHAIYLDSRTLVGGTIDEIDRRLAAKYREKARGV